MAVIMKIRNRLGAVIVALIAIAIISFLVMDALNSNSSLLRGNADTVGIINGQSVSIKNFDARYQELIENYKQQLQQSSLDEQTMLGLRDQTWNQILNEQLMGSQYATLGIQVTADELYDMVQGSNPHPQIVQAFSDPKTKKFDPSQVALFLQNLDNDETGETRRRWLNFEKYLKEDRIRTKYNNLIKKGLYVPAWLAKLDYEIKYSSVDFDFVFLPYSDIKDEEVKVTDEDIRQYIQKNKARFKQEASRTIEFVTFDIRPSASDTAKALSWLEGQLTKFAETDDDSIFIKLYSDKPFDDKYFTKEELVSSVKDTFFKIDTNVIVGPYLEEGYYIAAKLLDRKMIADSVEARHILLVPTRQEEVEPLRNKADSLKKEIEKGTDFATLAAQFSKDTETASKGGNWGVIKPGDKFETIDKALFYKHTEGDVFVVGSNDGFHVIQITKAVPSKTAVKVAFLARQITPSQETQRAVFAQAQAFAAANNSLEKFRNSNLKDDIKKSPALQQNDYFIFGIGVAREIVKWAFEAREGEVSPVFTLDDKYVVAALTKVAEKGIASVDNVRDEVKPEVMKEKKAVLLSQKVKSLNAASIEALASSLGKTVHTANSISFSNVYLPEAGPEPKVANRAFSLNVNTLSEPLAGDNGVYVLYVKNITPAPVSSDYSAHKQTIRSQLESRVDFSLFESMKKAAAIEDLRYKFY
jgi:peptidyl-prolyl cis-trans isomerase D